MDYFRKTPEYIWLYQGCDEVFESKRSYRNLPAPDMLVKTTFKVLKVKIFTLYFINVLI